MHAWRSAHRHLPVLTWPISAVCVCARNFGRAVVFEAVFMHKDAAAGVCWLFAGETGRQRDTLLPSHHVLQGCGNAVLGNTHVTCVAGRWFATHQQHVPVCSTRHQNGAAPVSCQLHGAHSEQRTSLYLVASDVLHQFKKSFLNNPNTKQDNVVTIISFCITVFCINSLLWPQFYWFKWTTALVEHNLFLHVLVPIKLCVSIWVSSSD